MGILYLEGAKTARDAQGQPVPFAKRTVYGAGSSNLCPIFGDSDLTKMIANPMTADAEGAFPLAYVFEGTYRITEEDPLGKPLRSIEDYLVSPAISPVATHRFASLTALQGDEFLRYSVSGSTCLITPGDLVQVVQGEWVLEVAPEAEPAPHHSTAGGVHFLEAGTRFSSLARFEACVARGGAYDVGSTVTAAGVIYHFAGDGNTDLAGLTGWRADSEARLSAAEADAALAVAAAGSPIFEDNAAGLSGTAAGQVFLVARGPGMQVMRNDDPDATPLGWLGELLFDTYTDLLETTIELSPGSMTRTRAGGLSFQVAPEAAEDHDLVTDSGVKLYEAGPFRSMDALVRKPGRDGETRELRGLHNFGFFKWIDGNQSNQIARDPARGVYAAPATNPTGGTGCWQRIHDGIIHAEWFGATGGADDTDAVQACDEFLREFTEAVAWEVSDVHVTRCFGDLISKDSYATRSHAQAALATLEDHDVITVLEDETDLDRQNRYRVLGGALVGPLSKRSYNGKRIFGKGSAKSNGFKLRTGSPSWMRLFAASMQDGGCENIFFNGDNPTTQWGNGSADQNNPDTELLVEIEGYGITWRNCMVRFSGGNGIKFRGIIGNIEVSGGDCVSQYNIGWGWVIDRMSSFKATKIWGEGNDAGDILLKHDMKSTDSDINTGVSYWKNSVVEIESIYSENSEASAPVVQIEGGHLGPRIGHIAMHGSAVGRTTIYLKNSADADTIYQGCQAGYFDLGSLLDAKIICESESRSNTFIRGGSMWSGRENDAWNFIDSGRDNITIWRAQDAAAFVPGSATGDTSIIGGSSNFVHNSGSSSVLSNEAGGMIGPVQDYHSNFPSAPGHARASGMNTLEGGTELNVTVSLNANIPAGAKTWHAILTMQAEAHQQVRIALLDVSSFEYYNWDSRTWSTIAEADEFGIYRVLRADRRSRAFSLPFEADNTARQVRINVRLRGGGEAKLFHGFVSDLPAPALSAFHLGRYLGTANAPSCDNLVRPPADVVPAGTQVWNTSDDELQISDGTTWQTIATS